MSTPSDDARRDLEQRALRNVRGLVDKVEQLDASEKRRERRLMVYFVAAAVVAGLAFAGYFALRGDSNSGVTVPIQQQKR